MSTLTPKSNNVSELDICLSQLTPFDTYFDIISSKINSKMEGEKEDVENNSQVKIV